MFACYGCFAFGISFVVIVWLALFGGAGVFVWVAGVVGWWFAARFVLFGWLIRYFGLGSPSLWCLVGALLLLLGLSAVVFIY